MLAAVGVSVEYTTCVVIVNSLTGYNVGGGYALRHLRAGKNRLYQTYVSCYVSC